MKNMMAVVFFSRVWRAAKVFAGFLLPSLDFRQIQRFNSCRTLRVLNT